MDNFVNRLEYILENFDYTASAFADKIGVQRSSLSHLLSGRNKPSLDFILKVNTTFPQLNLDWLIKGEGDFRSTSTLTDLENKAKNDVLKTEDTLSEQAFYKPTNKSELNLNSPEPSNYTTSKVLYKSTSSSDSIEDISTLSLAFENDIEHIVVFYKDGTFSKFKPRE